MKPEALGGKAGAEFVEIAQPVERRRREKRRARMRARTNISVADDMLP